MNEKFTVGLIVNNRFGVLNRVAALYSKRGYNIDSLAVGVTEDGRFSRMTIVSTGDDYMKTQVVRQLRKLHDVRSVCLFDNDKMISVEHMLIKLKAGNGKAAALSGLINDLGGKVRDFGEDFIIADITGSCEALDEFVEKVRETGIFELCRSGLISMAQGAENTLGIEP